MDNKNLNLKVVSLDELEKACGGLADPELISLKELSSIDLETLKAMKLALHLIESWMVFGRAKSESLAKMDKMLTEEMIIKMRNK